MTRFQAGSRRRIFDESGTVLPLIALGLVTLLGFSALAVDVGMGYAETRRSQNAADAGALAGIVEASIESRTLQSMVTNAVTYSSINLPEAIPMSRWLTDCPDTSRSSEQLRWTAKELNLTPATDCISFSAGFDDIRVSLPQRDIDTVFASVLGIDSYDISAFAEAGRVSPGSPRRRLLSLPRPQRRETFDVCAPPLSSQSSGLLAGSATIPARTPQSATSQPLPTRIRVTTTYSTATLSSWLAQGTRIRDVHPAQWQQCNSGGHRCGNRSHARLVR